MVTFLFWTATKTNYISKCSNFQKKLIDTITTSNFYLKFQENNENDMAAQVFWAVFYSSQWASKIGPNSWFWWCCHSTHYIFHGLPLWAIDCIDLTKICTNSNWNANSLKNNGIDPIVRRTRYTLGVSGGRWCDKSCPKFTMVCSVRYEVFNDSQEVKSAPIVLKNTCQH